MAWRSSGTTNDEMVNNLKRFGVIHSTAVEDGFRNVDRRFFVPQNRQDLAHSDQPLKEGNIHISAPHIYGSVVEALELSPGSSLSFLNLGCGTGYLSCIVAQILGPTSTHVGIEIHEDAVDHCRASMERWRSQTTDPVAPMDVVHGNALEIENDKGESLVGFDRIYIGASVEKRKLPQIAALLRPGGILVGPVDDELVKVVRIGSSRASPTPALPRTFRGQAPALSEDFSQQVLSGVRFAPLVASPATKVVIPSRVWSPSMHQHYPESFRKSCKEIMLCSCAPKKQPPPQAINPPDRVNVASTLPRAVWMEILSYTHRDWFEQPHSEVEFLRRRLADEQAASQRAQEARLEAETRLHMVERERDVYRLLALRWQSRLQAVMSERGTEVDDDSLVGVDDIAEAASAVFANEPLLLRLGGLSAMMRQFQNESEEDDDNEADDEAQQAGDMEEESEIDADDMDETNEHNDAMSVSLTDSVALAAGRPQSRTVSITSEDL